MKAIGFDADGVLVDSREAAWRAAERVRGMFGVEGAIGSAETMEVLFGHAAQQALVGEQYADVLRMAHRLLMRRWAPTIRLFPEAIGVAAAVAAPKVLITAALADGIVRCLGAHATLFQDILGFESGRKPDLLAALAPSLGVFVTDTVADIKDCQAVGIPTLACAWGYDPRPALEAARPDAIAADPAELGHLISNFIQETSNDEP